jgi:hypothetical protein
METDDLFDLLTTNHILLLIAVTSLIVAAFAIISGSLARRKITERKLNSGEYTGSPVADFFQRVPLQRPEEITNHHRVFFHRLQRAELRR